LVAGLESGGLVGELGGSVSTERGSRRNGLGLTLDAGVSVLWLGQGHDHETLLAGAFVVEPGIVVKLGHWSIVVAARGKNILFEHVTSDDTDSSETELSWWKTELGVKAGARVAI
jgi:hypothetical protein